MGTGRYLRAHHPHVTIHPIEPANSPTLSTGHRVGTHRIAGLCDEFVPGIVDLSLGRQATWKHVAQTPTAVRVGA